jgi:hypothetical protein
MRNTARARPSPEDERQWPSPSWLGNPGKQFNEFRPGREKPEERAACGMFCVILYISVTGRQSRQSFRTIPLFQNSNSSPPRVKRKIGARPAVPS